MKKAKVTHLQRYREQKEGLLRIPIEKGVYFASAVLVFLIGAGAVALLVYCGMTGSRNNWLGYLAGGVIAWNIVYHALKVWTAAKEIRNDPKKWDEKSAYLNNYPAVAAGAMFWLSLSAWLFGTPVYEKMAFCLLCAAVSAAAIWSMASVSKKEKKREFSQRSRPKTPSIDNRRKI